MNSCGNCSACCQGAIELELGKVYNWDDASFSYGVPCEFSDPSKKTHERTGGGCSIYKNRPSFCRKFQCVYTTGNIPGLLNPIENGIVASYKNDLNKIVATISPLGADKEQKNIISNFCLRNNIDLEFVYIPDSHVKDMLTYLGRIYNNSTEQRSKKELKKIFKVLSETFTSTPDKIEIAKHLHQKKMFIECYELLEEVIENRSNELTNKTLLALQRNLVTMYSYAGELEKSLKLIEKLDPYNKDNGLQIGKSFAYSHMQQKDKAVNILYQLLKREDLSEQDRLKVKFNLASHKADFGKLHEGWYEWLEYGEKMDYWSYSVSPKNMKEWDGTIQKNKTLYCLGHAGIGDEIINFRFAKKIKSMGMNVVWVSDIKNRESLYNVFERNGIQKMFVEDVYCLEDSNGYWVSSMKLLNKLNPPVEEIWTGTYISADLNYINKWKDIVKGEERKLKIGIRWKGTPEYDHDLHRSIPAKDLYESLKHLDADFYSLQIDNFEDEIDDFPNLINVNDKLKTWDDTLGLLQNLDFVVTSCTSVAHMSASSGVKTFVLTPPVNYHTWRENLGNPTPWYGNNVNVLKKKDYRNWNETLNELKNCLSEYET